MDIWAFFLCFFLSIFCKNIVAEPLDVYGIQQDIAKFNKTCLQEKCDGYHLDSLSSRACHCGIQCVQLGTCCIDSYYVDIPQIEMKPACRSVYQNDINYFMIDKCSSDKAWASLCNTEWNGEDDLHKLVPVTSLLTSVTYKNYYCLRCHETTNQFLYWSVKIESDCHDFLNESENLHRRISFTYFQAMESWMSIYDDHIGYFAVNISVQVPSKIQNLIHVCEANIISDCSEKWSDDEVRNKCQSYMAIKEVKRNGSLTLKYKNIHCALCNFESLDDIQCKMTVAVVFSIKGTFSFSLLLDINRSDGELVGKIQKCSDDHMWDPYAKKCRKLACALPGFKVQNGKCVQQ